LRQEIAQQLTFDHYNAALNSQHNPRFIAPTNLTSLPVFPYRIVVQSNCLDLRSYLLDQGLTPWIGLGIDFIRVAPPIRRNFEFQCRTTAKKGVVGGYLQMDGVDFITGVTCAHVVGAACSVVSGNPNHPYDTPPGGFPWMPVLHEPDATLLNGPCNCVYGRRFRITHSAELSRLTVPYSNVMAAQHHLGASFLAPTRRHNHGYVDSPEWAYRADDAWYRCPSMSVKPSLSLLDKLLHPFDRGFSQPGDSGSWIANENAPNEWLGMVAADIPEYRTSYVIDPQYLLYFFEKKVAEVFPYVSGIRPLSER
jgi:hypothetical protein